MSISISVIIPTCHRPDLLNRCLAALIQQDFDPATYEIIVCDDAASEETQQQVESWIEHLSCIGEEAISPARNSILDRSSPVPLKKEVFDRTLTTDFFQEDREIQTSVESLSQIGSKSVPVLRYLAVTDPHGPAAARNVGWRAATGKIIAFTDDDCIPDRGWLKAGLAAFQADVVGVRGRVIVPLPASPTDYEQNAAGLESAEFVTANCFYAREAIAAVGGFDERFTLPWREDSDLFFTLLERGSQLVAAPDAIVVHPIRKAPWGVSLSQQRKSLFNALLYQKHPVLYRERLQPVTPWHYYWIVSTCLGAIALELSGYQRLAIAAFCVWIVLTIRFCLQRLSQTSRSPQHIAEMAFTSVLIPPLSIFWRLFGAVKFRVFFL